MEGLDGSGKTTITNRLLRYLTTTDRPAIISRWNETTEIYNLIMRLSEAGDLENRVRMILGGAELAARHHWVIRPGLEAGKIVLVDKYLVSAFGHALVRGHSRDEVAEVYDFALEPDVTLYVDVDPEVALERKLGQGELGFWEVGLDQAVNANLGEALARFRRGEFTGEFLKASFLDFQRRLHYAHHWELQRRRGACLIDGNRSIEESYSAGLGALAPILSQRAGVSRRAGEEA